MWDGSAGMEYQQAVWIAADDGEDGGGYAMEVVALPCRAADSVVLNIQEESGVIGQTADVFGSMARGGNGDGVGRLQTTCDIDGHLFALGHDENVAARVYLLAEILDIGAADAPCVNARRVADKQTPLEAADAHFLERTDDGSLGSRKVAAEVAAKVVCIYRGFHRRRKDMTRGCGFCPCFRRWMQF